jgi:hypothetical protein
MWNAGMWRERMFAGNKNIYLLQSNACIASDVVPRGICISEHMICEYKHSALIHCN